MDHSELKTKCRHFNLCSCGAEKCLANYTRCTRENCPAFDAEDPVPVKMLLKQDVHAAA